MSKLKTLLSPCLAWIGGDKIGNLSLKSLDMPGDCVHPGVADGGTFFNTSAPSDCDSVLLFLFMTLSSAKVTLFLFHLL